MLTDYHVIFEVRQRGAIGEFEWQDWATCETITARDAETARDVARAIAQSNGLETRGVYCRAADVYYSLLVPYVSKGATPWHPTDSVGPFSLVSRGHFDTREEAEQWAVAHLGDTPWAVRAYKSSE